MVDVSALSRAACEFVHESPLNRIKELDDLKIFDEPIFSVASADDPIFMELKNGGVIGPNHMAPREWMPEAESVISYFLPFTEEVRNSNLYNSPSEEWLYGREEGEKLNKALRRFLVENVEKLGGKALCPVLDFRFRNVNNKSNWSERHIAYIAGLGTFNLNKSIITEKGSAGRLGSIITDQKITSTVRQYNDIYEYCLQCGTCIKRCPVGAITEKGKNINACSRFINNFIKVDFASRGGCGKCQTGVPCENSIPCRI